MGAETNKTDAVGRVEGMGLVYISGGGRSAISSSFLCRAQEVQGAAWAAQRFSAHRGACGQQPSQRARYMLTTQLMFGTLHGDIGAGNIRMD